jgi:hypothetical protein
MIAMPSQWDIQIDFATDVDCVGHQGARLGVFSVRFDTRCREAA